MTNRQLTALIVRLAGFALFIKIFDFFGSYFLSVYMTVQLKLFNQISEHHQSFDKLYTSGSVLMILNLVISLLLILKSGWIADKLVKNESEFKIDLTAVSVLRITIATIGLIYIAKSLYNLPQIIENVWKFDSDEYLRIIIPIAVYLIKVAIGIVFFSKARQIAGLALRKMESRG